MQHHPFYWKRFQNVSNRIMSSTYSDEDDDDMKKVVALRGDFTNCECVDWAWVRVCLCLYVAVIFFHSIPTSPFIHLTQSSSGVLYGKSYMHTHTHARKHIRHRRAPYSKNFYLCCSSIYDDYCLFLLYYYCQSFQYEIKRNSVCTIHAFEYDICQLLALSRRR